MTVFLRPFLELTVVILGLLLAYLPLNAFLKHSFARLLCWVIPFFLGLSILGGLLCRLSAMAENGDLGQIREYLFQAESRIPSLHTDHLILIQVENAYDGEVRKKNGVFQSSKRKGNGVGIQSVRRISEKSGGANAFTYENGIFTAKIMLHG